MLNASLCTQIIWNDSPVITLKVQKGGLIIARIAWWWSGCLGVQYSVIYHILNWQKCGCENIEHTEDFGAIFNILSVSVGICEIFNDSLCTLPSQNTDKWLVLTQSTTVCQDTIHRNQICTLGNIEGTNIEVLFIFIITNNELT